MHSGVIRFSLACARLAISVAGFAVRVAPTLGAGRFTSSMFQDLMPMLLPYPSASRRRLCLRMERQEAMNVAGEGGRGTLHTSVRGCVRRSDARHGQLRGYPPQRLLSVALPGQAVAMVWQPSLRQSSATMGAGAGMISLPEVGTAISFPVALQQSAPVSAATPHVRSACKWGADNVRRAAATRSGRKGVTLLPPAFAPQLNSSKEIA